MKGRDERAPCLPGTASGDLTSAQTVPTHCVTHTACTHTVTTPATPPANFPALPSPCPSACSSHFWRSPRVKEYVSLASRQNRLQARPAPRHTARACPSGRLEAWSGWPVTCEWDGATRALCLPAARSRVHTRRFVTRTAGCVNSLLPGSDCWRLLPFRCALSFSCSCNCLDSLSGMRTDRAEARLICPDIRPSCRGHPHQRQHRLHCGKAHAVAGVRFLGCGDPTRGKRLFYFKSLKSSNGIKVF